MSLVNEALKKARVQATGQQAAIIPLPPAMMPVPSRTTRILHPIVLLVVGLICGAIGLFSAVLVRATKPGIQPLNPVARVAAASALPQVSTVHPRLSLSVPPPPVAPADTTPSAVASSAAEPTQPSTIPSQSSVLSPQSSIPTQPALVEGKTYLQAIEAAGVPKLKLDGILWSDQKPLALINGITAAPGDDLGDVTVVGIEPKRVKLRAEGKEFFIRLP